MSLALYRASVQGNWDEAERFLNQHNDAIQAPLNCNLDTALHVAAKVGDAVFAREVVIRLGDEAKALGLRNRSDGLTPLHLAAQYGNVEVAKILVGNNPNLLFYTCNKGLLPIHYAACNTRNSKDVFLYFSGVTRHDLQPNPYEGQRGATLVVSLINQS